MKSRTMYTAVAAAFLSSAANLPAETFYWKNDTVKAENWKSYADLDNWAVGTSATAGDADRLPSATDDLFYGENYNNSWSTSLWMDLGGERRELRYVVGGDVDYAYRYLHLKNGTLVFNGGMTNSAYRINVYDTGRLVLPEGSASRFGHGTQFTVLNVLSGGVAELKGKIDVVVTTITVHDGGTLELPSEGFAANATYPPSSTSRVVNAGELNLPNGFSFAGGGTTVGKRFELVQQSGTLNLGGRVVNRSLAINLEFLMCGGLINVTDDVSFVSDSAKVKCIPVMTNDCSAVFCVSEGKTFDASNMEFGERTTVRKTGAGAFRAGKSLPASLSVEEGVFEPTSGAKLGSALSFARNATLRFVEPGIQADAIAGIGDINVEVADSLGDGSCILFSSPDAALVATIYEKLTEAGFTGFTNKGDSITREKSHSTTVFAWKNEGTVKQNAWREGSYTWHPFLSPSSWLIGFSKEENSDGLVPDENDDIFISDNYKPIFAMDMGGAYRKVRNLALNLGANTAHPGDMAYYPEQAGFRQFNICNGTLEFTGSFTNVRAEVVAKDTGRFIFGPTSAARLGYKGAENALVAEQGGEIDVYGLVDIHILRAEVDAGGKMVFAPSAPLTVLSIGNALESYWRNSGILEFPRGLAFSKSTSSKIRMLIEQNAGVLSLGGPIVREADFTPNVDLMVGGGTIKATDDVSFSNLRTNKVAAGSAVVFDVEAGKTLDVSNMVFDEDVSAVKTGAGVLRLGSSLPASLSVQSGAVAYSCPVALDDTLSLAPGTTLVLESDGISASDISGIDSAYVATAESLLSRSGAMFFTTNSTLAAAIHKGLADSGIPGLTLNGNVVLREIAHDSEVFTFQSKANQSGKGVYANENVKVFEDAQNYMRFFDPASWSIGRQTVGVNPGGYVPGENDDIYINNLANDLYNPLFAFDMCGAARIVRNYDKTDAVEKWGFNGIQVRNGTFGFSGEFVSTRSVVIAQSGGRFVFGDDARVVLGYDGAQCYGIVKEGGEIVLAGDITFNAYQCRIDAGGTMTINPKGGEMKFIATGAAPKTFIHSYGTLNVPNGLIFSGTGRTGTSVTLEMLDGFTLNVGGKIVKSNDTKGIFAFTMGSGVINATNAVAVSGFGTSSVAEGATITVNIPKGSSLNLSEVEFGADTTVEKYGSGRIVFGTSRPSDYIRYDPIPGTKIILR